MFYLVRLAKPFIACVTQLKNCSSCCNWKHSNSAHQQAACLPGQSTEEIEWQHSVSWADSRHTEQGCSWACS